MNAKFKFLLYLLPFAIANANAQTTEPSEYDDTIVRAVAIQSRKDTVRLNEIVEMQINSLQPATEFTKLFIDGIEVTGARRWKSSSVDNIVYFKFSYEVFDVVEDFVENTSANTVYVPVYLSVGTANGVLATAADPLYMVVKHPIEYKWWWASALMIPFIVLTWFCLKRHILKDDNNEYYSLGRTQLFAWTAIFGVCYFYIWIKTGILPDITSSVLIILGISAGTTAAAKVIEIDQNRREELHGGQGAHTASQGWLRDILTDRSGANISVHRYQNVLFTIVFGVIFIQKVISSSVMPDFDQNALILMGISSTTYAGLKITEQNGSKGKKQLDPKGQIGEGEIATK